MFLKIPSTAEALLLLFHAAGGGVYDTPKAVANDTETSPALPSNKSWYQDREIWNLFAVENGPFMDD